MSISVVRALGLVTVQDLGRPGRMHEALPPGGALVPSMLVRANRALGNPDDAAAIEVCGQLVVRVESDLLVATDGQIVHELHAGEELTIASDLRVAYLAVQGGIDVPITLGGRGAHLSAGIGRLVRANDRIDVLAATASMVAPPPIAGSASDGVIRLVPGPDRDAFVSDALERLCDATYRISSSSDRVGTRLEGPPITRRDDYVEQSRPMVVGAIEVPRDGVPIILGPEHPTTGGYPILAVVSSSDLDALHSIPLGGTVRFRM